nr:hypothetical protein [Tanacetum cinerariifolium]
FWASISVKKTNDVVKLQALIDRKKVVITEDTIRQAFRFDDADGVECLPNDEIFAELARIGYEKPPPKLTFYKAFFSAQWKFLIHMIVQCMSVKRTAWNEFSSSMASAVICLATGRKFSFFKHIFDSMEQPTHTFESFMTLLNGNMYYPDPKSYSLRTRQSCSSIRDYQAQAEGQEGEIAELHADEDVTLVNVDTTVEMDADIQGRMEEDVTAAKEINATESEPTVFDDEE